MRVWATEWDVFHCTPSPGGRGRRAAVDIFRGVPVFFLCLVRFRFFSFSLLERTRPTASTREPCLRYLLTSAGVRTGCISLISLCVSVTFNNSSFLLIARRAVRGRFPQTRDLWKRDSNGLTHGTCFLACRLELDAVAGLLWISWCVLGGADFFSVFFFSICFLQTHTACCKYEATLPHLPL